MEISFRNKQRGTCLESVDVFAGNKKIGRAVGYAKYYQRPVKFWCFDEMLWGFRPINPKHRLLTRPSSLEEMARLVEKRIREN